MTRVRSPLSRTALRISPLIVALIGLWVSAWPAASHATVIVGGPFALTAPDGKTVSDQTYRGRWLLVYFGYTSCPDTCPIALSEMAASLKRLGSESRNVQPIFITIDPRRDTREVVKDYVQSIDARVVGLTGTQQQIDSVTAAYGAYAVRHQTGPGPDDYLLDHSGYIYLMNPAGAFVRAFDAHASGDEMAAAISKAMVELRRKAVDRPQISDRQSVPSDQPSE